MPEIKLQHILTLTKLLQHGAKYSFIQLTTTDLGKFINRSQQAALKHATESIPFTIDFKGTIVSGMGEGAYYMSLAGYKKQFKEKLGYEPYPGTLHVKLTDQIFINSRREINRYPSI